MSADAPASAAAMTDLPDVRSLVEVADDSTVSRTVLKADGARLVLFSFDVGQELTEHTAAMPVLLQALDGRLSVTAAGRTVELVPGGVVHLTARLPHAVRALEPTRLLLTMLDPSAHACRGRPPDNPDIAWHATRHAGPDIGTTAAKAAASGARSVACQVHGAAVRPPRLRRRCRPG